MTNRIARCKTADGVRLSLAETGPLDAPTILFVHGFSQSRLCWRRQFVGTLAKRFRLVAYDLRGHGLSDKPAGTDAYSGQRVWADDLLAVLDHCRVRRAVVVGWSFGVEVVRDYLRSHGGDRLRGIVLVSGRATPDDVGPGLASEAANLCSEVIEQNIAATIRFVRNCSAAPLAADEFLEFVAFNCMASREARIGIRQRAAVQPDELAGITVPALIIHGDADRVILPVAADRLARHLPNVKLLRYTGCGHLPFIEQQNRFDRDLAEFSESLAERDS